jgi:ATP-dependent protease ClpP protease subunit
MDRRGDKPMEQYVKFYAPVTSNTAIQLQQVVEQFLRQGLTKLHLLLSTPGGSVHDGLSLYNFLKGLPIEICTYNFGSVDSIGVVLFCARQQRFSVQNARFLLHPVAMQVFSNQVYDEPGIEERINALKADQKNIANVISETTGKNIDEILDYIHKRTTFDPDAALGMRLVTEIKQSLVPAGASLTSVYDFPVQQPQVFFPMRGFTDIGQQNFSTIPHSFSRID